MAALQERIGSSAHASTSRPALRVPTVMTLPRSLHGRRSQRHRRTACCSIDPIAAASAAAPSLMAVPEDEDGHAFKAVVPPVIIEDKVKTRFIAETMLPTRHGKFRLRGYKHSLDGGATFTDPTAIICGAVEGQSDVPVRVHDACFTSEVLGSMKCDCSEQLQLALDRIQSTGLGIVIYLQQEGRGIGLANKIAAYSLQEGGLDTVDANRALGLPDDCREYTSVRNILRDLRIGSVQLMTNNPRKISVLTGLGINVTARIPCMVQAGEFNQGYLEAKARRMDHMLGGEAGGGQLDGSYCFWDHDGEPTGPTSSAVRGTGGMGLPDGPAMRSGALHPHTVDEECDDAAAGAAAAAGAQQPAASSSSSDGSTATRA